MTAWIKRVKFRDLLNNYDENADDEMAEIERIKPLWIERFNSIENFSQFIPALKKVKTESEFNKWLNRVYDYCDIYRIWVEW